MYVLTSSFGSTISVSALKSDIYDVFCHVLSDTCKLGHIQHPDVSPPPSQLGNSVRFFNCSLLSLIIKRDSMALFHCNSLDINTQRKEQQQWQKWGHTSVVWRITVFDRLAQSPTQRGNRSVSSQLCSMIIYWQEEMPYLIPTLASLM